MPHFIVIRVYTTRITKLHDELLISILLLLLHILPIYLGMCPSVPTHIHQHMSKLRLLLKIDNETNGLCLQWSRACPRPWSRVFRCWSAEPKTRHTWGEPYIMPIQKCNRR